MPDVRYATAPDGVSIAYSVFGDGPFDLVLVPGFASHVELAWEWPAWAAFASSLASFSRVVTFDKRGTGLSDRVNEVPTLEQRMDDVRVVMDAAKSEHASFLGLSEGVPTSLLLAATHPERVRSLVCWGGLARSTWAPDYPWAAPAEALIQSAVEFLSPALLTGEDLEYWAPSLADDKETQALLGRLRRSAGSPEAYRHLFAMFLEIDVRSALPAITTPTLVLHRRGDRIVNYRGAEWMASQIPGATFELLEGRDHFPWTEDGADVGARIRRFLTGRETPVPASERFLATVMFTDLVGSTQMAVAMGDARWRATLETHDRILRKEIASHGGIVVKTLGDGVLATFDGPGRAVRCGARIVEEISRVGLEVRIGLHAGEVEKIGADIGGIAVNIASRIAAMAGAAEILTSATVKGLVAGSGITFDNRGEHTLKGIPDMWQIFRARP